MTTLAARGSGTPATTGTTWASVTNAVDGAAGTNPATYATMTNATASAVATIEVTGYGFSSSIASTDTLNSVTVSLRHFENNTGRFASVRFQAFDGATAIGTATTCTLATGARNDTATPAVTLAQLRSSTFKIVVTITGAASTQSRIESIDYVDVTADYTIAPPSITQAAYRFYADGTETGATALAAQDTGYTADTSTGDVNLQVRTRLQSTTAIAVPTTDDWRLQYEKNTSGTWNDVIATGAQTLADSYAETNASFDVNLGYSGTGRSMDGQSFLGNGQNLSRASFWLKRQTGTTGTITAELYAHDGTFGSGQGIGTALATSTTSIAASSLGTTYAWVDFDFAPTYTLTNGTAYCIVAHSTGLDALAATTLLGADSTTPTHPGCGTFFDGAWGTNPPDRIFRVYTTPVGTTAVPYASANLTDGAATTNRLGAGTGSFVAGKISETGLVTDLGWTANNHTELLYSVTLKQADLAPTDTLKFRVLRNGATTGLTYTQTPTVTIGTAGPTDRTGTATGTISLSGSASGQKEVTGTVTGSLTITGAASGSAAAAPVLGTATGSLNLSGVAVGTHGVTGTATGALSISGVAAGQKTVGATATGSLALTGSASGVKTVTATAAGTLTVAGVAAGVRPMAGVATGTLTLSGVAAGTVTVTAVATGSLSLTGTASGLHVVAGIAVGSLALAGVASGTVTVTATASSTITLSGTATGLKTVTGAAAGQIVFASTALGLVEGNAVGTAVGSIAVVAVASGVRGRPGTATGGLVVSGAASGVRATAGTGVGQLQLTAGAVGTRNVTALATGVATLVALAIGRRGTTGTGTGPITIDGTGSGSGTGAGGVVTIIGEWNDQQTTALQWGSLPVVDWFMLVPSAVTGAGSGTLTAVGAAAGVAGSLGTAAGTVTVTGTSSGIGETPAAGIDVLLEPFNNYTTNNWALNGTPTIVAGRTGTAAQIVGSTTYAAYNIASPDRSDTATVGFAYRWNDAITSTRDIIQFRGDSGGTSHTRLRVLTSTGALSYEHANLTVIGASAGSLVARNVWAYLEVQTKLHATTGAVTVRVNGTPVITLTNVTTQLAGSVLLYDQIRIINSLGSTTQLWDDLYLTMGAGAVFKGSITI